MFKKTIILLLLLGLFSALPVYAMRPPAGAFCQEQGYTLESRSNEKGTYSVCIFPDSNECSDWDFYYGKCGLEYRREIPCKKFNEIIQVGDCCDGLEPYLPPGPPGMPRKCGPKSSTGTAQTISAETVITKIIKEVKVDEIDLIKPEKLELQPTYNVTAINDGKLFFLIPVKITLKIIVNGQDGQIISIKKPWWSFFVW